MNYQDINAESKRSFPTIGEDRTPHVTALANLCCDTFEGNGSDDEKLSQMLERVNEVVNQEGLETRSDVVGLVNSVLMKLRFNNDDCSSFINDHRTELTDQAFNSIQPNFGVIPQLKEEDMPNYKYSSGPRDSRPSMGGAYVDGIEKGLSPDDAFNRAEELAMKPDVSNGMFHCEVVRARDAMPPELKAGFVKAYEKTVPEAKPSISDSSAPKHGADGPI